MELIKVGATHDNNLWQDPNEGCHPLTQHLVLASTFEYLKDDQETLLSCRQVHPEWVDCLGATKPTSFPVYVANAPNRNIYAFRRLLSNQNANLTVENLNLGSDMDLNSLPMITFLQDFGTQIRKLAITNPVNALSILTILRECRNLRHLEVDPLQIRSTEILSHEIWENQLPQLKSLTIHCSSNSVSNWYEAIHEVLIEDNNRAIADLGLEMPLDFVPLLLTKISSIEKLKTKNYSLVLLGKIERLLNEQPEIAQRLKHVHINLDNLFPFPQNDFPTLQMNLKVLEVQSLISLIPADFSTLLSNVADTLEVLTIQEYYSPDYLPPEHPKMTLEFRNEMTALREILIFSTRKSTIVCATPNNLNLFERFPKLKSFQTKEAKNPQFKLQRDAWDKMFPRMAQPDLFVHNGLSELCVDFILPSHFYLLKIKSYFPQLRSLGLTVMGKMLQKVVVEFCGSQIRDLKINYLESQNGIEEFASGITGLSLLSCKRYGSAKWKNFEMQKARQSFSDWKNLRNLMINKVLSKKHYKDDEGLVPLTNVCITHGFATMKQLHRMTLIGFEIHPEQATKILRDVPLLTFDLAKSKLNDWNWKGPPAGQRAVNTTAVEAIRNKFPSVSLKL